MIPRPTSIVRRARRVLVASTMAANLMVGPVVGSALGVIPSVAAASAPTIKEQVDDLNARAVEKFQAKEYEGAVELFLEAYDLQPEANYLFNIGRIYEESGDLAKSVEYYERFVKEPGVPLDARERGLERLRVLRAILEETERKAEPEVEPEVEPEPEPEPQPQPQPEPDKPKRSKLRIAGYVLLGTGGATLAAGGGLAGVALQRANTLGDQHTLEERNTTIDSGRTMALTADILFGVGGAVTAAGLVMVLVSLKRKPAAGSGPADARLPQLSPWAARRAAGVAATVRF